MNLDKKSKFNRILEHVVGVLVAAALAGLFTFLQSIAADTGLCSNPEASLQQGGALGGIIKAGHSYLKVKSGTFFL